MASEAHEKKRAGMIAKLPEKTGKTLEQWVRVAKRAPAAARASDKALSDWLETEHGLGHFQARLVVPAFCVRPRLPA